MKAGDRKKQKILFISHSPAWGGAEKCLYLLLKGIDRQKYEPLVVLPQNGELENKIRTLGIMTRIMNLEWCVGDKGGDANRYLKFIGTLKRRVDALAELMRKEQVDLVFTNTAVILEGALAAKQCGIPHVWHVLELLSLVPELVPYISLSAFYRLMNGVTNKTIAISQSVKREIAKFVESDRKIDVIYTGIENQDAGTVCRNKGKALGFSDDASVVSFIGALSLRKGVLNLPEVALDVLKKYPETKFIIMGRDEGVSITLRKKIDEMHLNDVFHILAFQMNPTKILANTDIFVLPSLAEPLGLVLLEAMHMGIPVVATRSGGPEEIVLHEETGILVPVNSPRAIADAIIALLDQPERMKVMGQRGRERAQAVFSYEKYIENFDHVFEEVVGQNSVDPLSKELIDAVLELFEGAATDKMKIMEQKEQLKDLESLGRRVRSHPVYRVYHWLRFFLQKG